MIAKAPDDGTRGHDTGGLLRYLFGKGKANEHTTPHLVAAWDPEWLAGGAFADRLGERGGKAALARQIDAAMTGHDIVVVDGHVYHVVLSAPEADSNEKKGFFGDARWRELAESAIEHMGFGPDVDGVGGCRWVAVHHGLSVNGNDHVHLLVNLVRGDGRIADTFRDFRRWREWCLAVEERYGLTRTSPVGMGRKATSAAELDRAVKKGTDTDRQRLTQLVGEAAAAAGAEEEFLDRLRRARVRYKPHLSAEKVAGYTVSLNPSKDDPEPLWFAGSTLRRDLSLPRLRARWDQGSERASERYEKHLVWLWTKDEDLGAWQPGGAGGRWSRIEREVRQAGSALAQDVVGDRDRWSEAVSQTADLVVVFARFDPEPDRLHRTGDLLSRAAQLDRSQPRPRPRQRGVVLPLLVSAARAAAVSRDPAPLMLAAIVVLVYSIIITLQYLAEQRQHRLHASTRQYIAAASTELSSHPAVVAAIARVQARQQQEEAVTQTAVASVAKKRPIGTVKHSVPSTNVSGGHARK